MQANVKERKLFDVYQVVIKNHANGITVGRYLSDYLKGFRKHRVDYHFRNKLVWVNDELVDENYVLFSGAHLMIKSPYKITGKILPEPLPLDIVYEDNQYMVINKPQGMASHTGLGIHRLTLMNALTHYFEITNQPNVLQNGLVHRLDKDTSGLIVYAKNMESFKALAAQFKDKSARRTYNALVWGNISENEGVINVNVGRNPLNNREFIAFPEGGLGKTAHTEYTVLKRIGHTTLVECRLQTGRTHQIRLHMQHIGHSVVGDLRYPPSLKYQELPEYKQLTRMARGQTLHARSLSFFDVWRNMQVEFEIPLPSLFETILERAQNQTI